MLRVGAQLSRILAVFQCAHTHRREVGHEGAALAADGGHQLREVKGRVRWDRMNWCGTDNIGSG